MSAVALSGILLLSAAALPLSVGCSGGGVMEELTADLRKILGSGVDDTAVTELLRSYSRSNSMSLSPSEAAFFRSGILDPLRRLKMALIVVDYQNDFVDGSLAVGTGDAGQRPQDALPYINSLIGNSGVDQVVYTQDWHPPSHISFVDHAHDSDRTLAADYANLKLRPFDVVHFTQPNLTQRLYPSHCVPGTWGSQLAAGLTVSPKEPIYIRKGTEVLVDSYSAFKNNNGRLLELDGRLRSAGIGAFIACGLAYDICVHYTLKDGSDLGYLAAVSPDCAKGFSKAGIEEANRTFEQQNIAVVSGPQAEAIFGRSFVPIEWVREMIRRGHSSHARPKVAV